MASPIDTLCFKRRKLLCDVHGYQNKQKQAALAAKLHVAKLAKLSGDLAPQRRYLITCAFSALGFMSG